MRWLITGGCGFLGRALVARLAGEGGHSIRVLDNLAAGSAHALSAIAGYRETTPGDVRPMSDAGPSNATTLELVVGDVRDGALCLRAAEGADVIVHLAAVRGARSSLIEPRFACETDVGGTLNMLEAARHADAKRFVFPSGNDANGGYRRGANGMSAPAPLSPRGAARLAGEGYCAAYWNSFGVATVALRLGNLYGPGDANGAIGRFIYSASHGDKIEIHGDGRQIRDFLYVDDAAAALIAAARGDIEPGRTWQVSGGEETSVGEAVDMLRRLAKHAGWPQAEIVHGPARAGTAGYGFPGAGGPAPLPDWQNGTGFAQGLARTVRWRMDHPEKTALAA